MTVVAALAVVAAVAVVTPHGSAYWISRMARRANEDEIQYTETGSVG